MKVHRNLAENIGGFLACRLFKIYKRCEKVLRQAHWRRVRVLRQFNTGHEAYAPHGKGHELLAEAMKRLARMKADPTWQAARSIPRWQSMEACLSAALEATREHASARGFLRRFGIPGVGACRPVVLSARHKSR